MLPAARSYYILTDVSNFGFPDDVSFIRHLVEHCGVAAVPGSSFFESTGGGQIVRFCFCKNEGTLRAAAERLEKLRAG